MSEFGDLRHVAHHGDLRDLIAIEPLVCVICDYRQEMNLDRWGIDWPELVVGWTRAELGGHLCPKCSGYPLGGTP